MRFSGKTIFVIFFLFLVGIIVLLVYFFTNNTGTPGEDATGDSPTVIDDGFGIGNIRTLPVPDISVSSDRTDIIRGVRDDRVVTGAAGVSPSAETPDADGESPETPSRLTRIFIGPTAGYRIDRDSDGVWVVRIIEQGRGDRYIVRTVPYSIDLVSTGEFTRVFEGIPFSGGSVLMLYENPYDESASKSAFVDFAPTGVSEIRRFEDTVRTATDNGNKLFFTKRAGGETLGIIVDVENPEETAVVWTSHFNNWIPRWGRDSMITLSTPISSLTKGYVYLLDPSGEEPTIRLTDIPSGGSAFVDTSSGFFVLYEADKKSLVGTTRVTDQDGETDISMPSTLPEKCDGFNGVFVCAVPHTVPAITRSGYETVFPDSWYQGDIVLRDALIQIDAVTGTKKLLFSSDQEDIRALSGGKNFDIIHPRISEDGKFVFFTDKNDLSLWMFAL